MIAVHAAAMDMFESTPAGGTGEMSTLIAVNGAVAALVPEGAITAPIAVDERAVRAVIIAVIIIGAARHGDTGGSSRYDASRQHKPGEEGGQDKFREHY